MIEHEFDFYFYYFSDEQEIKRIDFTTSKNDDYFLISIVDEFLQGFNEIQEHDKNLSIKR